MPLAGNRLLVLESPNPWRHRFKRSALSSRSWMLKSGLSPIARACSRNIRAPMRERARSTDECVIMWRPATHYSSGEVCSECCAEQISRLFNTIGPSRTFVPCSELPNWWINRPAQRGDRGTNYPLTPFTEGSAIHGRQPRTMPGFGQSPACRRSLRRRPSRRLSDRYRHWRSACPQLGRARLW